MMGRRAIIITFMVSAFAAFIGCYEDMGFTLHDAHVYKGKIDPHEDNADTRNEKLKRRFLGVQTDR